MSQTEVRGYYTDKLNSHNILDLIEIAVSVYSKNKNDRRKMGTVDMKYKNEAETLLHGELAEALGIPEDEVRILSLKISINKTAVRNQADSFVLTGVLSLR